MFNEKKLLECFQKVSLARSANIFIFSHYISYENADYLFEVIKKSSSDRENIILFLTTPGGDPDAAYRMQRFIKRKYKNFILFVFGPCKSAGTLLALGADEIVMSDHGEFGPLDIQIPKEESRDMDSALTILQSLEILGEQAGRVFEKCLASILDNHQQQNKIKISLKTAEEIAENITKSLLEPISRQIDPLRFVAVYRQAKITEEYGRRLNQELFEALVVDYLIKSFPSHGFIIDREEAKRLFNNYTSKPKIKDPTYDEQELADLLEEYTYNPCWSIINLEEKINQINDEDTEESDQKGGDEERL